ncbi:MAG: hypothetical protein AAF317_20490 [Pseudomonadota bacterium]
MMRFVFLILMLSACLGKPPLVGQSTVTADYQVDGGFWSEGSTIRVFSAAEQREGRLAICGAWSVNQSSALTIGFHERVLSGGLIRVGGQTVLRNLLYLNEIRSDGDAIGETANCALTDLSWDPGHVDQLQVRIPRQTFGGGIGSDEQRLTFRQGQVRYPY